MANITLHKNEQQSSVPSRTGATSPATAWDPFRVMHSLLGWDPFQSLFPAVGGGAQTFSPAFEVRETGEGYVFLADLPGVKEADLDISLAGNLLTVSGKREIESGEQVQGYHCYERGYGPFSRSFTLPQGADTEHLRAEMKDGVLTLFVPKRPEVQPRKITLGVGQPKTQA